MNTAISALTRTAHDVRRAITLITRLTRRGEIKVRISVSVPPFGKLVLDYKADFRVPPTTTIRASSPVTAPDDAAAGSRVRRFDLSFRCRSRCSGAVALNGAGGRSAQWLRATSVFPS